MTYCVALSLDAGLVFASDTRTNAGVDQVGRYGKMRVFSKAGERVVVALSAGNLSFTQSALNLLELRARHEPDAPGINNARSMFEVARLFGDALREVRVRDETYLRENNIEASGSFIIGGQIDGERPRLFLVYSEGNCIETSSETPYFQSGEVKFGKPIIDRAITPSTTLDEAVKCVLVSFDSTIRSNITAGLPIDLLVYRTGALRVDVQRRIEEDDAYFQSIRTGWNDALRGALHSLPCPHWLNGGAAR
jgi:putative proteasome-type protease